MSAESDCPDDCAVTVEATTYRFSKPLLAPYKTIEGYISTLQPRIHKDSLKADEGAWAFRRDWEACGGSIQNVGTIDLISGNLVALMVPEAKPDRLFAMAYFSEYGLLQDDILDASEQHGESGKQNMTIWTSKSTVGDTENDVQKRNMVARLAYELFKADRIIGRELWDYMKSALNEWDSLDPELNPELCIPTTVDEYLRYRVLQAHVELFMIVHRFGIGLQLSKEEQSSVAHITDRLYEAFALVNDYYSWDVEYAEYLQTEKSTPLVNAVFLISQNHSISPSKAKRLLKMQIRILERRYFSLKKTYLKNKPCSATIMKWFEVVELTHAGTTLWSCTSARYQKKAPRPTNSHSSLASGRDLSTPTAQDRVVSTETYKFRGNHEASSLSQACVSCKAKLDEKVILEPYEFLSSLPSKGNGDALITSLNVWYNVPETKLKAIRDSLDSVIQASLMVDDIEDQSLLRRGYPATHTIYGPGRTINTSNYLMVRAMRSASPLSEGALGHLLDELQQICIGQGHDLLWTYNCQIPTEAEYAEMISRKCSGHFRIVSKLMKGEAATNRELDTTDFMTRFGQYFQIRDDYCNLTSSEYAAGKGFCDDLDEGKLSFMLIHALSRSSHTQLISILQGRKLNNGMSFEMKHLVLKKLEEAGSFEYTRLVLRQMYGELEGMVDKLERKAGSKNWVLRLLLQKLDIDAGTGAGVV